MRLCIDIDGTLCELRQEHQTYAEVQPLPGAVETLKALRGQGHYIILATARHMKTCDANVGMVVARQGKILLQWLEDHQIEYDEIWFGKPNADIYIDDRGYRFQGNWHDISIEQLDELANPEINTNSHVHPVSHSPVNSSEHHSFRHAATDKVAAPEIA